MLTPAQVQLFADALREPVRSFTLLLVLTGLRVGELLALRWGNVDLKARLLRAVETVYDGHFDNPKRSDACARSESEQRGRKF